MKRIIIILLALINVAYGQQKVLLEAGKRVSVADTTDTKGTTAFAWWGDSFTANGTAPIVLGQLMGLYPYNGGVGGETSTQIKTRFLADTAKWVWPTLIWAGRNNSSDSAMVVSDIAEMVSKLGHTRYLIVSVFNAGGEPSGSSPYINIQKINSSLSGIYGSRFVDARSYIVSQYDPLSAADVWNNGRDEVPKSLRATNDSLHLNETGYRKVAQYIYANYKDILISNGSKLLTIATNKIGGSPAYLSGLLIQSGKNMPHIRFFNNFWQPNNTPAFIDLKVSTMSLFFGSFAGGNAPADQDNYSVGYNTLATMSGGSSYGNIALGSNALSALSTSSHDVLAIGYNAGISITSGSSDAIFIGKNAGNHGSQKANCVNCIVIGGYNNSYANRNHQAVFGGQTIGETQLQGSVGVNLNMVAPKTNAQFQVNSSTKGSMPWPRLTTSQASSISVSSVDSGLVYYNLDSLRLMIYTGTSWKGVRYSSDPVHSEPTGRILLSNGSGGVVSDNDATIVAGMLSVGKAAYSGGALKLVGDQAGSVTLNVRSSSSQDAYSINLPLVAGAAGETMVTNGSGNLEWKNLSSDDYTPTVTNVANMISSTDEGIIYTRVGNKVRMDGSFSVSLTSGSASTTIRVSLPVSSDLQSNSDVRGIAGFVATGSSVGTLTVDSSNDEIVINFTPTATSGLVSFSATYTVR